MGHEIADLFDGQISRAIGVRIARVLPLAGEDRGDAVAPRFLHDREDPRFVVHEDVVLRRIAPLDVVQCLFSSSASSLWM